MIRPPLVIRMMCAGVCFGAFSTKSPSSSEDFWRGGQTQCTRESLYLSFFLVTYTVTP